MHVCEFWCLLPHWVILANFKNADDLLHQWWLIHTRTHAHKPCRYERKDWGRGNERKGAKGRNCNVHAWSHHLVNACADTHTHGYIMITGVSIALGYLTWENPAWHLYVCFSTCSSIFIYIVQIKHLLWHLIVRPWIHTSAKSSSMLCTCAWRHRRYACMLYACKKHQGQLVMQSERFARYVTFRLEQPFRIQSLLVRKRATSKHCKLDRHPLSRAWRADWIWA